MCQGLGILGTLETGYFGVPEALAMGVMFNQGEHGWGTACGIDLLSLLVPLSLFSRILQV